MKCMEETTEQVLLFANNLMRVAEKNEEVKGNLSMLDEIKRWWIGSWGEWRDWQS